MEILEITKEEYKNIIVAPFSKFETAEFVELNKHKVEEVKYFIFNNGKNRFGFVAGIKDGILKAPFSATYGIFSEITNNNSISYYVDAVNSLVDYCKMQGLKQINIKTPALCYDRPHITKFQNALMNNNFKISDFDINFEYYLQDFDENYLAGIQRNARKNYNKAEKSGLKFEKTNDVETVYKVIKINREFRGFPLWMSLDDVKNTSEIIPSDFFIVSNENGTPCSSALVHHLKDGIARVVYWGNTPESEEVRPINFLSYNLFKYYNEKGIKILDIGTSTLNTEPNIGLCDFKESIGCKCSPKINFERSI